MVDTSQIMLYFNMSVKGQNEVTNAFTQTDRAIASSSASQIKLQQAMAGTTDVSKRFQNQGLAVGRAIESLGVATSPLSAKWRNLGDAISTNISRQEAYAVGGDKTQVALRNNIAGVIRTDRVLKRLTRTEEDSSKKSANAQKLSTTEIKRRAAEQRDLTKKMEIYQGNVKGLIQKE